MNYKNLKIISVIFLILAVAGSFCLGAVSVFSNWSAGILNAVDRIAVIAVLFFGFVHIILQDHAEQGEESFIPDYCSTEPLRREEH